MRLSDTALRRLQPSEKVQKLSDGGGLQLHVMPTGGKLWRLAYRFGGKQKLMAFGAYPAVTLAMARDRRDEAKRLIASGIDPMAQRKAEKAATTAAREHHFEAVARDWWLQWQQGRKSDKHVDAVLRRLQSDVFPSIGQRPVSEIEAPELVAMVKKVAARGALDIARRCLQMTSQVFRYAVAHGLCSRNPAADIRPGDVLAPRVKENYARIDSRELPELLKRLEAYPGTPLTRLAVKLMAHTFVRTGELIAARWDEFDFDTARWCIPAARMKMGQPHIVPLSQQALQVLAVLKTITGDKVYLFPGERGRGKHMSNNTILKALERMGYKGRMTGHGFRGVASTVLHEHGFPHDHIERQLAHCERNAVSAAYNHAQYLPQRADMMAWWGAYLEGLASGKVSSLRDVKKVA